MISRFATSTSPSRLVIFYFKSHGKPRSIGGEGALDQFAVRCEQVEGFGLGHGADFVFEAEGAVVLSGGVEEFFEGGALVDAGFELGAAGGLADDVPGLVGDFVVCEPFPGVSAGAAGFVAVDDEHAVGPFGGMGERWLRSSVSDWCSDRFARLDSRGPSPRPSPSGLAGRVGR